MLLLCNLHGFCHLIDLIAVSRFTDDENHRQKMSDLRGLISFNYNFPETVRYRAFLAEVSNVDRSFNDPRLLQYKPKKNVKVIFCTLLLLSWSITEVSNLLFPPEGHMSSFT